LREARLLDDSEKKSMSSYRGWTTTNRKTDVMILTKALIEKHDMSKFDLVSLDAAQTLQLPSSATLLELKKLIESELQVPVASQRLWPWVRRQNQTMRPGAKPLSDSLNSQLVTSSGSRSMRNAFYLQTQDSIKCESSACSLSLSSSVAPRSLPGCRCQVDAPQSDDDEGSASPSSSADGRICLLFFKLYSPQTESIEFAGEVHVHRFDTVQRLADIARRMASFGVDVPLDLFEEVKPDLVEWLRDPNQTIDGAELGSGDIIVFQRRVHAPWRFELPTPIEWYERARKHPELICVTVH
jgi:ICP0-binding domain of Ubiquitin-specific protease 7